MFIHINIRILLHYILFKILNQTELIYIPLNMFFLVLFLGFLDKNNDLLYRSGKEVLLIYYESNC